MSMFLGMEETEFYVGMVGYGSSFHIQVSLISCKRTQIYFNLYGIVILNARDMYDSVNSICATCRDVDTNGQHYDMTEVITK